MSHGEDDDDPQLRSLRAVWLAMPDEDPPERGLTELLAAARVKATEMAAAEETPSFWQRFAGLLRRPPVLALATVIVLIGGGLLISNRHDNLESRAPATKNEMAPTGQGAAAPVTTPPALSSTAWVPRSSSEPGPARLNS